MCQSAELRAIILPTCTSTTRQRLSQTLLAHPFSVDKYLPTLQRLHAVHPDQLYHIEVGTCREVPTYSSTNLHHVLL